jgi:hypothetical protein
VSRNNAERRQREFEWVKQNAGRLIVEEVFPDDAEIERAVGLAIPDCLDDEIVWLIRAAIKRRAELRAKLLDLAKSAS